MGVFDRQIAQVKRQIKAKGEVCVWTTIAAPTVPDATKPWITVDGAATDNTVSILWVIGNESPLFKLTAGSETESAGRKGLMASVGFTPKADDVITLSNGTSIALQSATPLQPNGELILWRLVFKS